MKKNIGSKLALYPMPITVVGAMNGDKPTWTLVGILGSSVMTGCLSASPHRISSMGASRRRKTLNQPGGRCNAAGGGLCRLDQRCEGG